MALKCKEKIRKEKDGAKKIAEERDRLKADLEEASSKSKETTEEPEMGTALSKLQDELETASAERD